MIIIHIHNTIGTSIFMFMTSYLFFCFWSVLCSKKCLFIFQSFFSTRDFVLVCNDNPDINILFSGSGSGNYSVFYSTVRTLDYRICFTCNTFVSSQNCNVCVWERHSADLFSLSFSSVHLLICCLTSMYTERVKVKKS